MEGGSGGECRASEGHGPLGCGDVPATPPSLIPQPTLGYHGSGACDRQVQPSRQLAQMGDEVRQLQGQPHRQPRAPRKLLQEFGQGAARTPQEHPGRPWRLQEQPQATQEREQVAVEPQEKPQATVKLQEMRAVAQLPEAKVSGVGKPLPWAAKPPQPWMGGLTQLPCDVPDQ